MADYNDLINLVKGPVPAKPLPAIWNFFPCHAGAVGGVPDFLTYYFDVDEKLRLQLKLIDLFPEALILPGVFPDLGVIIEVSAFGGPIRWFKKGAPFIGEVITDLKQIDNLKMPIAGLAGLMPLALVQREAMARKMEKQGREIEGWMMTMGPAEVAGLLMGYQRFYLGIYDDPGRIKTLMEMITELLINWLEIQNTSIGGAGAVCVADHVCNQVRPEQLNEFILPYEQAVFKALPKNAVKIYHNEGFHTDEHIESITRFGADLWHFGSDVHEIGDILTKLEGRMLPFGGVDPHGVMRSGTPDQVRAETKGVVEAARGQKLLLSTGTGTTPETTFENQRAMVEQALL